MALKDYATGTVLTAPIPATSGTSVTLNGGEGARFATPPFFATAQPPSGFPTLDNSEKIKVTAITDDTLTIERAQGNTSAQTIEVGWRISAAVFADDIGDMFISTYDPNGKAADAFDYDNFENTPTIPAALSDLTGDADDVTEGTTHLFLTSAERTKLTNTSGTNTGDQTSVTGNAGTATKLATARTFQTNLASTTAASFDGSANNSHGVTGSLPVSNGGTGRATATTAYGLIAAGTTATGAQQTISPGTSGQVLTSNGSSALPSFKDAITLEDVYPVGALYFNASVSTDPGTVLGFGTWTSLGGYTLVGYDSGDSDFGTLGEVVAGEKTHTLTVSEMPSHNHTNANGGSAIAALSDHNYVMGATTLHDSGRYPTSNTGGGGSHNNIQPSFVVYMWYRSA